MEYGVLSGPLIISCAYCICDSCTRIQTLLSGWMGRDSDRSANSTASRRVKVREMGAEFEELELFSFMYL